MKFEKALKKVKNGKGMRLPSWSDDVAIYCEYPDENSKMTAPFLYIESRFGIVPWKETFIEMFSQDWEIVEPSVADWNETPTTIAEPITIDVSPYC